MKIPGNGSTGAFPHTPSAGETIGITLREFYVACLLVGRDTSGVERKTVASVVVSIADAIVDELEKSK